MNFVGLYYIVTVGCATTNDDTRNSFYQ